jgi:hypothetical protein
VRVVRGGRVCYLDNLYGEGQVGVELDGVVAHPPGERWRDFQRDNAGVVDGIVTLRYGWADVAGAAVRGGGPGCGRTPRARLGGFRTTVRAIVCGGGEPADGGTAGPGLRRGQG